MLCKLDTLKFDNDKNPNSMTENNKEILKNRRKNKVAF